MLIKFRFLMRNAVNSILYFGILVNICSILVVMLSFADETFFLLLEIGLCTKEEKIQIKKGVVS